VDKGTVLRLNAAGKTGYFLMEDFALGLKANLTHLHLKSDANAGMPKQTVLLAGPFLRKYVKAGIFGEAGGAVGLDQIGNGNPADLLAADLGLGYTYFLNNNIALEPMLVVVYSRQKSGGGMEKMTYSEIGPEFRLGIQAFLFKPKLATPEMK
jgi:hypothetical protein